MADVFISYSRKDKAFVQRLDEALRQREREAWVDWEGIRPTEEFMQAIYSAIEGADTFLFVLTPDSIASVVCGKEIAHAVAQNKRMIPLVAREVDAAQVPEALAKLNWIFCRESDAFDAATDTLISALDTDLGWVRAHTRLITRAVEWEAKGGNNSFVLRGDDLRAAEQWLTEAGTDKERQPTALQTAYIIASRKAAARRQRITLGAVTFGAVVAIVLAIVAWFQREKALRHERIANDGASHSEYLRALSLLEDNDADQALHTLARSLELAPSNSFAATRLINLLGQREWPHLAAKQKTDLPVKILKRNADGSRILLAAASGAKDSQQFFLYESLGLKLLDTPELKDFRNIEHLEVSGDTLLAMLRDSEPIALLADAKTGRKLKVWKGADEYHGNFSTDGKTAVVWNQKTIEVVSVADGKRRFSNLNFPKKIRTVTMNGTEVNILTDDGEVTIQPLKKGSAPAKPLSLGKEWIPESFCRFGLGGNVLLAVRPSGDVEFLSVAHSGNDNQGRFAGTKVSKGLKMFALEAEALAEIGTFDFNGEMTADFDDKKEMVTIVRYDSWSEDYVTRSSVTQFVWEFHEDRESTWNTVTDWHSSFTPICLLSPGIAVAQDRKVFVLPLLGNPLSGPLRHEGRITAICQIKARTLATGAADGIVKLWELAPAALSVVTDSGPVVKSGVVTDHFVKIHGLEILGENGDAYLPLHIKGEGRDVIVQTPELQSLHSVELSADGTLGIFSGDFEGAEDGGAWTFDVKDGKLLSVKSENCEWAGFNADGKQILTIQDGRLTFWNIGRDKEGRMTFEATGRILTQTGMKGAVVTGDGRRVATRSSAGEVIVWDENGKPLQSLRQAPLWQDVNLDPTAAQDFYKPVFDAKGQVLATAYGRTFVVWDVESGKPLSDPVSCAARIRSLEFSANDSTKILATLQDGSIVSWTHAFSGSGPAEADVVALRKLALAVADDRWVEEAPKLAAGTQSSSPVVAKLLEHFASQARTLGEKSTEHPIAR